MFRITFFSLSVTILTVIVLLKTFVFTEERVFRHLVKDSIPDSVKDIKYEHDHDITILYFSASLNDIAEIVDDKRLPLAKNFQSEVMLSGKYRGVVGVIERMNYVDWWKPTVEIEKMDVYSNIAEVYAQIMESDSVHNSPPFEVFFVNGNEVYFIKISST